MKKKGHSKKKSFRSKQRDGIVQEQYKNLIKYGYGGLGVFVLAVWVARSSMMRSTSSLQQLLESHCQTFYCSPAIAAQGRELQAKTRIRANSKLLTIPREVQIWDIDALRSPQIQPLLSARHETSKTSLHKSAYLAAYLALLQTQETRSPYLQYLPTYDEFTKFHPLVMDSDYISEQLGGDHSYAYALVTFLKEKIQSEYQALSLYEDFSKLVSANDYMASRIHVLSRTFRRSQTNIPLTPDERVLFQSHDTTNSLVMIPLLDAADHRIPQLNVIWNADPTTHDVNVYATKNLEPAADFFYLSYGNTEPQEYMFAIYGFCLGTEPLSRSLSAYHRSVEGIHLVPGKSIADWQKPQLIRYLSHDDGYPNCIEPSSIEFAFKALKLQVLERFANAPNSWIVTFPGRRARPHDPPIVTQESLASVLQTCRLLALTHLDYNGTATDLLRQQRRRNANLATGDRSLEIRAWAWLYRLARMERNKYESDVSSLVNNDNPMAQVQLGELLTLEAIMSYAQNVLDKLKQGQVEEDFFIRETACPIANVEPLISRS
eukprot:scaffold7412_cov115-Cylindrotheca_fusiformis.AAC.3